MQCGIESHSVDLIHILSSCSRNAYADHVRYTCDIYHDFACTVSIRRRVFDFTVSSVSNVSMLYFSRAKRRHVYRHVIVSGVRNQRMYTL